MKVVKKIGSVVLVLLVLLNVLGYYGIFMGLDYQNNRSMLKKLDAGIYDGQDEITIKFPLAIPYLSDAADFERVDGRFEHEGQVYRKVRQRYSQDTLTVVCVKDHTGTQLHQALKSYLKTFSDKHADSGQTSKTSFTLIKAYFTSLLHLESRATGWHCGLSTVRTDVAFIPSFSASIIHPPE